MNLQRAALFVTLLIGACGESDEARWLAQAEAAHTAADDGDVGGLESFVAAAVPSKVDSEDARVVLQDSYYRLGWAALRSDEPAEAITWVNHGLQLGNRHDLFAANLFTVRGEAREALGQAVEAASDYHEALVINDRLLQEALEKP